MGWPSSTSCSSTPAKRTRPSLSARCCWPWRATCASSSSSWRAVRTTCARCRTCRAANGAASPRRRWRSMHPWRYASLSKAVNKSRNRRRDLVQKVQAEVDTAFSKIGMKVRLAGREKTLYAIYQKMDLKHLSFAQVTDIYGFRVIVPTVTDCYTALGVLHQMYKPVPGKFKDHIAIAKLNGYQSLHTTLVGPSGVNIEFQMRTDEMHVIAEAGVAAHWLYKAQDGDGTSAERLGTKWLQSLLDIQNETRDAAEFWDHVKVDLFPDAVYVFTPKSQIMALPR